MEVILKETIERVGEIGDVLKVKTGFYRNYLAPNGLAVKATKGNLKTLEQEKEIILKKKEEARQNLMTAAEKLNDAEIVITKKVGEEGKLFGTVTSGDIVQKIKDDFDADIDKKKVHLEEHIKFVGTYDLTINFAADIKTPIKVIVKAEE